MSVKARFCRLLDMAIEDEKKASSPNVDQEGSYAELANALQDWKDEGGEGDLRGEWDLIQAIRSQEHTHHSILIDMRERRCGNERV